MINIPGAPVIGSTNRAGIWTPNSVMIGVQSKSIDNYIDLTAETLDSRVTYTGPAHYYLASDGTLKQSSANQWPVEYVNGVAVGRHEPEAASSNLITTTSLDNLTSTVSGSVTQYRETTTNSYHRLQIKDATNNTTQSAQIVYIPVNRENFYFRAPIQSSSSNSNVAVNDDAIGYMSTNYASASVKNNGDMRILQVAFSDRGSTDGFLTSNTPLTDDSIPGFAGLTTAGFDAYCIQTESTAQSTSPIAIGASRIASSVAIDTTGATSITISYSDGTSETVAVTDSYTLPVSTLNWGSRYLTRISFEA